MRFFILGGGIISLSAGMVNAVTLLSVFGVPSTHVTGMLTQLAVESVGADDTIPLGYVAGICISFIIGAAISGMTLPSSRLRLSHRYGTLLILESLLLVLAAVALKQQSFIGILSASVAAGLQNALATQYSGTILRTTHVTGVITDLGVSLGRFLRGAPTSPWRVYLHLCILIGFGGGSIVGAILFMRWGSDTMYIPAALIAVSALVYWRRRGTLDGVSVEIVEPEELESSAFNERPPSA